MHELQLASGFVYQCTGPASATPVIYLPGVQGCWTSQGEARPLFASTIRLIEIAYPPRERWTLHHYADALSEVMNKLKLDSAHLVGESFGSLVGWQFGKLFPDRVRSHILVGGFTRAPGLYRAGYARLGLTLVPSFAFDQIVNTYAYHKRKVVDHTLVSTRSFPGVRGKQGQLATANRMHLIQQSDFRQQLAQVPFAVRYVGGSHDRLVPVGREIATLRRRLSPKAQFDDYLIQDAPHMVIASHPDITVDCIRQWVNELESCRGLRV